MENKEHKKGLKEGRDQKRDVRTPQIHLKQGSWHIKN